MLQFGLLNFRRYFVFFVVLIDYSTRTEAFDEQPWKDCKPTRHNELLCEGFIPKDVPFGTNAVRLVNVDSRQYSKNKILTEGRFLAQNWGSVFTLGIQDDTEQSNQPFSKFDSFCFRGLNNLKSLHISFKDPVEFTEETFASLDNVTLLDLSGCSRLPVSSVVSAMGGRNILPGLRALNLSMLNIYWTGIELDDDFFQVIRDKKIEELDLSLTQISFVNVTSLVNNCGYLIHLKLSKAIISDARFDENSNIRPCPKLKYIDISYIILPTSVIPLSQQLTPFYLRNTSVPLFLSWAVPLEKVEYLDISGLPQAVQTTFVFDNVAVLVLDKWQIKTLIMRYMNLERLDINLLWPNWTIEHIDASNCKCQFISPSFFTSAKGLKVINLSYNLLHKMLEENVSLFEKLFEKLHEIRMINISGNLLETLPRNMFTSNKNLQILDLSENRLTQITFDLNTLKTLKILNLRGNVISILDSLSIAQLQPWLSNDSFSSMVDLRENSLICSTCGSFQYVQWIWKSKDSIYMINETTCFNEETKAMTVDESTLKDLEAICNRPKIIIGTCISSALLILILIIFVCARRKYLRDKQYKLNMEERIQLIREGANNHEFVVFLSYSSNDDDFVHTYVKQPLQENLQRVIGLNRELVCEGDIYFRLGRSIPDEISHLLRRASAVVVVLSDNYCNSVHCRNEFDQAFMLEKPVILMVKGHVNIETMTPLISDIYNTRTRIHWHEEGGKYVLQTSWENICTSVIDLVQ